MLKCITCGANPHQHSVTLYRLNWKGRAGVWACHEHHAEAKRSLFPDDNPHERDPTLPPLRDEPSDLGPWTGGTVDA